VISHIVLFNPKDGLTDQEVRLFAQQLHETMKTIPTVLRATVGRRIDVQSEGSRFFGDMAYRYSAVIEFADRDDLVAYLTHPLHRELGRKFWEFCASTVVTEVETADAKSTDVVDLLVMSQIRG